VLLISDNDNTDLKLGTQSSVQSAKKKQVLGNPNLCCGCTAQHRNGKHWNYENNSVKQRYI